MKTGKGYPIELEGEVIEVIRNNERVRIRLICKHDLIIEADDSNGIFSLGELIRVDGKLSVRSLERMVSGGDCPVSGHVHNEMHIIHSKPK